MKGYLKNIALIDKGFAEINPVNCGEEKCASGHTFGPAIRKYTLIHHVLSGKGKITNDSGTYEVTKGEAFIINPGEVTVYTADADDPWHYIWIGFDGSKSTRFASLPTVINSYGNIFKEMMSAEEYGDTAEEFLSGKIFELYAKLFSGNSDKEDYLLKITNYVNTYYNNDCDVSDIAKVLNLERHYLSRLFRQKTGKTLKSFITEKRMEEAKKLLADGCTIAYSALMCGYKDQFLFSKTFKKMYGISPNEWKNNL